MSPEEQKEFIDALEERVFVVVMTLYDDVNEEPHVISSRYTPKEMIKHIKENSFNCFEAGKSTKCVYIAHYKDVKKPVSRHGFI